MTSEILRLLQASSCFRGEVCATLPCACAETLAALKRHAQQTPDAEIARLTPYVEAFRREEARADKLGQELDDLRAAQCAPNPILQKCDELHDLGFNAGWNGAIEQASKIAENNGWEATAAQIRSLSAVTSTDGGGK